MYDNNPILVAQGKAGGRLTLFQDSIRIERRGVSAFLLQGLKGDKDIQISSISESNKKLYRKND